MGAAVFIVPDRPNREIDRLIGELDEIEMPGDTAEVHDFNPSELLPPSRRTFRYKGSTTTPPCVSDVRWIAFAERITFSEDQIETIAAKIHDFNEGFGNNRVIQERNGRIIKTDLRVSHHRDREDDEDRDDRHYGRDDD